MTFFNRSVDLELVLGLLRVLVQACAVDLQMTDHGIDGLDGHELAGRVIEPADVALGLRVLRRQGDYYILVKILTLNLS